MSVVPMKWATIGLALAVAFGLIRKLFPVEPAGSREQDRHLDASAHHACLTAAVLVWLFVVTPALTWGLCVTFMRGGREHVMQARGLDMAVCPHWMYWTFVTAFIAMLGGALLMDLLCRVLLRRRYAEFVRYQELYAGFDSKAQWPLLAVLGTLCALAVVVMLGWYVGLRGDALVINRLWSTEEVRELSDVQAIYTAPEYVASDDRVIPCRLYRVVFNDGTTWWTLDGPMTPRRPEWKELAEEVSRRAGVPMTEVAVLE